MTIELGFTLLGSFISLLLIVNGYFTRKTLEKLTQIEIDLKENIVRQQYIEAQSNHDHNEVLKLRDRVHSLEGAQASLLEYINNHT